MRRQTYEPSGQTPSAFHTGRDGVVTINSTLDIDNCDVCCCSPDRDGASCDNAPMCNIAVSAGQPTECSGVMAVDFRVSVIWALSLFILHSRLRWFSLRRERAQMKPVMAQLTRLMSQCLGVVVKVKIKCRIYSNAVAVPGFSFWEGTTGVATLSSGGTQLILSRWTTGYVIAYIKLYI